MSSDNKKIRGLIAATTAYMCWGFMPLYWALLKRAHDWEIVGHRILWSLLFIFIFLCIWGRFDHIRKTIKSIQQSVIQISNLFLAASLAALNWWINIHAVNTNQVIELGIGMFLTPLMSVVFGLFFFSEKLSKIKTFSVLLPTIGVLIMIYSFGQIPWIALGVSSSWAMYGVFKKRLGIDPWVSNMLEVAIILPFACIYLGYLGFIGRGMFISGGLEITGLLISVGIVTSIPMIAFASATNNLPLSILGFVQYLNPILTTCVGIFLFHEPFQETQLVPLLFIWSGIGIFIFAEILEGNIKQ